MSKFQRWFVLGIVSSALLLIVIDMTVLYTALPRLTHDLQATASEKLWIVNAYSLVMAGLLLGFGTLGDRLGHKRMFVIGLVIFGAASLLAALAPAPLVLIIARVILAVGAAMMMPATLSIIRITFEDERERSLAIGVWASVSSGGAGLGPLVGGFLLEHFYWGSVFLINIPIVLLALIFAIKYIPRGTRNQEQRWDWRGSIQIMIGLVGIVYAVKEFSRRDGSVEMAIAAAVIGVGAVIYFVWQQNVRGNPLVDFRLFREPRFTAGVLTAMLATFALVGTQLLFTQRLQLVLDYTPLQAGLYTMSIPLASFVSGIMAGVYLSRNNMLAFQRNMLFISGIGLLSYLFLYEGTLWLQLLCLIVLGFGLGGAMTAASNAIMANAPIERAGMAASIEEVSYELGGALGVAILGSLSSLLYTSWMTIPAGVVTPETVRDSLDEALLAAEVMPARDAEQLIMAAKNAFGHSFTAVLITATAALMLAATTILFMDKKNSKQLEGGTR